MLVRAQGVESRLDSYVGQARGRWSLSQKGRQGSSAIGFSFFQWPRRPRLVFPTRRRHIQPKVRTADCHPQQQGSSLPEARPKPSRNILFCKHALPSQRCAWAKRGSRSIVLRIWAIASLYLRAMYRTPYPLITYHKRRGVELACPVRFSQSLRVPPKSVQHITPPDVARKRIPG